MNQNLTFAFIGGDLRQIRVMTQLSRDGHTVKALGFEETSLPPGSAVRTSPDSDSCLKGADVVVLPLPYNSGEEQINAPFSSEKIYISDIVRKMSGAQLLFAGRADHRLNALAQLCGVHLVDYMNREELSILNGIPTVEGALEIAMAETPYTIHGSRCLVLGYGRIGKLLSDALKALGAQVSAAARKHSDLAWMKAAGIRGIPFPDLISVIGQYDIIFNTIPAAVLDFKLLSQISDSCLILDLASRPGGVDFKTARELGKKVIWALSLPGKVAPDTAGDIIKDTIVNILEELGV